EVLSIGAWAIAMLLFLAGWARILVSPPPSLGLSPFHRRVRIAALVSLVAFGVSSIGSALGAWLLLGISIDFDVWPVSTALSYGALGAFAALFLSGLLYLSPLFERSSWTRHNLREMPLITLWGGVLTAALRLGGMALLSFSATELVGATTMIVGVLTGFITALGYFLTLCRLHRAIGRVDREIALARRHGVRAGETPQAP